MDVHRFTLGVASLGFRLSPRFAHRLRLKDVHRLDLSPHGRPWGQNKIKDALGKENAHREAPRGEVDDDDTVLGSGDDH